MNKNRLRLIICMTFICFPLLQGKESNDDPQAAKKLQHKIDKEKKEKYKKQDADLLKAALADTSWTEWIKTFNPFSGDKLKQQYCQTTFEELQESIRSFKGDEKKIASIMTCTRQYPTLMQNSYGHTPLHLAAMHDLKGIANKFISAGGKLNIKDNNGWTPLHTAAKYGCLGVLKTLVRAGADVHIKNNHGKTPLQEAVLYYGRWNIVEILIDAGSNLNVQDNNGRTALHEVANNGLEHLAEILISAGADLNIQDKNGNTPLDIAKAFPQRTGIVQLLEQAIEKQNKQS